MFGTVEITLESLSAARAVEKLSRAGISVLSAQNPCKNTVVLRIARQDYQKTFAILRGSCYNIKKVRKKGVLRLAEVCKRSVGLIAGAIVFLGGVLFFQSRILKVEIVGNGAYYEREILAILRDAGVGLLSPAPADVGKLTAEVLSLPRVEFCSFSMRGGIFTVEVECAEEVAPLEKAPLLSPATGVVEELVVVRGTPLVSMGEEVSAGQIAVADHAVFGGREFSVLVIAKLTVRYSVSQEYELDEAGALAQAYLDFGELADLHTAKTDRGWIVEGTALSTASSGLD